MTNREGTRLVELTDAECMVLSFDLEHDPFCPVIVEPNVCCVDESGARWTDGTMTVPFIPRECTCGYFRLLEQAQAKVRAALRPDTHNGGR